MNAYGSSNGAPGPGYGQNEASYELHADLDTTAKKLTTTGTIAYTNNSPDTLPSLWVQFEQNSYRKDSRSKLMGGRRGRRADTDAPPVNTNTRGFVFDSVRNLHGYRRGGGI